MVVLLMVMNHMVRSQSMTKITKQKSKSSVPGGLEILGSKKIAQTFPIFLGTKGTQPAEPGRVVLYPTCPVTYIAAEF